MAQNYSSARIMATDPAVLNPGCTLRSSGELLKKHHGQLSSQEKLISLVRDGVPGHRYYFKAPQVIPELRTTYIVAQK